MLDPEVTDRINSCKVLPDTVVYDHLKVFLKRIILATEQARCLFKLGMAPYRIAREIDSDKTPLCELYDNKDGLTENCYGCPIQLAMGDRKVCSGSPYSLIYTAMDQYTLVNTLLTMQLIIEAILSTATWNEACKKEENK